MMVSKYSWHIEERQINVDTGKVWSINDVPSIWKIKTKTKVESDGFYFDEDGTAYPIPPNEEQPVEF